MNQQDFINLFINNMTYLFTLKFPNDKTIINDKHVDAAVELIPQLYHFDLPLLKSKQRIIKPNNYDINKPIIKSTHKQEKIAQLFETIIYKFLDELYSIYSVDDDDYVLNDINIIEELKTNSNESYENVINKLKVAKDYDDLLWNQDLFDDVKTEIAEEIERARFKPSGTKGLGKCGRCGSEELYITSKQTRACDEGSVNKYTCLACDNQWTIG